MLRRITNKGVVGIVDDDEIWFSFGGSSKACFSLREFTLITGLKPGNEEEYRDKFPRENRLERKYFNACNIVPVEELESTILERVEDEEDKYKLGLVLIYESILRAKEKSTSIEMDVWAYESIPSIANLFQASMTKDKIPRMRKWKSSLTLGQNYISNILDSPNDVCQPLPTSSTHRRPTAPITGRHILDAILALTEKVNALDRKVESILEMRHQAPSPHMHNDDVRQKFFSPPMHNEDVHQNFSPPPMHNENVHRTLSPPPMHDEEIDMTVDRTVDVASNVTKEKVSEQMVEVLVGDVAKRVGAEEEEASKRVRMPSQFVSSPYTNELKPRKFMDNSIPILIQKVDAAKLKEFNKWYTKLGER
ncbi:hypothetical protein DH2020_023918 [Rehmannia glutinosa]|uniref:DUF1985 domain-containing protein n=1 Tax=Rehmannia glutinosa TaxID=99300 RepID=A0ABR0W8T7_REHGL